MENQTKELTAEQEEIVNMINNVCPPIVNSWLAKVNKFRKLFNTSSEVIGQFNELISPTKNNKGEED